MSENNKQILFTFIKAVFSACVVAISSLLGSKFGEPTVAMVGASLGTTIAVS